MNYCLSKFHLIVIQNKRSCLFKMILVSHFIDKNYELSFLKYSFIINGYKNELLKYKNLL